MGYSADLLSCPARLGTGKLHRSGECVFPGFNAWLARCWFRGPYDAGRAARNRRWRPQLELGNWPASLRTLILPYRGRWLAHLHQRAPELYVTHDGAKSWQETRLTPPAELGPSIYPMFMEMPMFKDSQNGYLAVHYSGPEFSSPKLVVYATESGGKSWDPIKVLPGSGSTPVALADS